MSTKNPLENTQNIINEKIAKTCNIIFFRILIDFGRFYR